MEVHCNYCNWVGQYPSPAKFNTLAEYEAEVKRLDAEHDAQCPQAKKEAHPICLGTPERPHPPVKMGKAGFAWSGGRKRQSWRCNRCGRKTIVNK